MTVTIPEGWRAEQAAQKVEASSIARADEVLGLVRGGAGAGLPLAEPLPAGATLEGYLFPETYEVAKGATARTLVEMMARQFDKAVTPKLRQQVSARGLTLHQAVTLASIVEREAAIPAEQPIIASVYLNRLRRDMPLQADPTVQFAVASANLAEALGFGYWKHELSRTDLQVPSPYNTYVQRGCRRDRSVARDSRRWRRSRTRPRPSTCTSWRRATAATSSRRRTPSTPRTSSATAGDGPGSPLPSPSPASGRGAIRANSPSPAHGGGRGDRGPIGRVRQDRRAYYHAARGVRFRSTILPVSARQPVPDAAVRARRAGGARSARAAPV